jgi:hypothetical protein
VVDAQTAAGKNGIRSSAGVKRRIKQFSIKIQVIAQKIKRNRPFKDARRCSVSKRTPSFMDAGKNARLSRAVSVTELTQP